MQVIPSSMCSMVYVLYIIYSTKTLFSFGKYFGDLKGTWEPDKKNTDTPKGPKPTQKQLSDNLKTLEILYLSVFPQFIGNFAINYKI